MAPNKCTAGNSGSVNSSLPHTVQYCTFIKIHYLNFSIFQYLVFVFILVIYTVLAIV